MAEQTKIEWSDASWSPWWGCSRVSPGCVHCYAESLSKRYGHNIWGPEAPRRFLSDDHWRKPLIWDRKAREAGRIMRVFPSMCDPLEDRRDLDEPRERYFRLVDETPNLMHLILTKRPENWQLFPDHWREEWPSNAMFGFTAENHEWLDRRRDAWLESSKYIANLRTFLSIEPMLGQIDLGGRSVGRYINWVICGGESGHGARPMHPDWARSLRDQCVAAGVPFLFKQWGEWGPSFHPKAGEPVGESSVNFMDARGGKVYRVGKKAAGRLLDGREWNELPKYWPSNVGMPQKAELVALA